MKTQNAQTLGVHLSNDIVDMVARRAKARGVSKSRYAAMVFEAWRAQKFPALDTVDSTARAIVLQDLAGERAAAIHKGAPTVAPEAEAVAASMAAPQDFDLPGAPGTGEKPRARRKKRAA